MHVKIGLALLMTFAINPSAHAEIFPLPPEFRSEVSDLRAVTLQNGSSPWKVQIRNTRRGKEWIFVEEGEGLRAPFTFPITWKVEGAFLEKPDRLLPLWSRKEIFGKGGSIVQKVSTSYDFDRLLCRIIRENGSGKVEMDKTVKIPTDTIPAESIAVYFRALPLGSGRDFTFHLFTLEGSIYTLTVKNRGIELLETPAGKFRTYKLEIVPELGILGVVSMFLPKTFVWHTVEKPHFWVKYRGLEGGLGSREIFMELTKREILE